MNFFERQAQARRASQRLVALFAVAVVAIVVTLCAAALAALWFAGGPEVQARGLDALAVEHVHLLAGIAIVTTAVIGIASLFRTVSLRAGGGKIARDLGGTLVTGDETDPQLRRLRNVVEEIAIAASVPVPEIYVLEAEAGINAFAAGYAADDAAIAVTRGALERLNRDELQGVIAHEFSHVLNGDMRLNIRLMGVLFGILVIGLVGRKVIEHARPSRDSKETGAILLAAFAVMVIGYVGLFFGRMIKAGVSRSREYLADASAVQFTRQTHGIAGALKKIAGVAEGAKIEAADREEVSHMLFGDGIGFSGLFATHPPLVERIRALDPQFDASALNALQQRWFEHPPSGLDEDQALGLTTDATGARTPPPLPARDARIDVAPAAVAAHVAHPLAEDIRRASGIHQAIPPLLRQAAHSRDGAMALVLALLLDQDAAARAPQLAVLDAQLDAAQRASVHALLPALDTLHPLLRLPLASLAVPAVRRRPRPDVDRFLQVVDALIHADGAIGLFEYCLGRLLRRQVVEARDPSRHPPTGKRKLSQNLQAVAELMAVLATHGHASAADARRAFAAGMQRVAAGETIQMPAFDDWVGTLDRNLSALDALDPFGKQMLIEGLTAVIAHDGRVYVPEAELLRTVCAFLHCPVPPLLEDAKF